MDWTGTSRSSFVIINGYGDSCGEVRVVLRCVEAPEIKINHLLLPVPYYYSTVSGITIPCTL